MRKIIQETENGTNGMLRILNSNKADLSGIYPISKK